MRGKAKLQVKGLVALVGCWVPSFIGSFLITNVLEQVLAMVIITAILFVVGGILNYQRKPFTMVPHEQSPKETFRHRLFLSIITAIEAFDAFVAFSIGILYLQLVAIDKVIVGIAFTYGNILFGALMVVGILFAIDVVRRFRQFPRRNKN